MDSQPPSRDARANAKSDRAIANSEARSSRPRLFIIAAALAVLVVGVGCSLLGAWKLKKTNDTSERAYFDRLSERITTETKRRLRTYVYGLNGARSLYQSSKIVERGEFRSFVNPINLREEFPGALGFSFIQRVPRGELDAFIAAERASDAPGFTIRTTGNLPELYVTKFIEPREANREAEGFDIATEPVRREAADRAMLTGEPTLSGKITLLQDKKERVGFFYLVPVYGNDRSPATPEERQRDLVGWIAMPLVVEETMAGVTDVASNLVDVEIYDGPQTTRAAILYDEDHSPHAVPDASAGSEEAAWKFHDRTRLDVGGREWTLWLGSSEALDATRDRASAIVAGMGGITISCLLAIVIWGLGTGRARALAIAQEMTADLVTARDRAESALRETEALHSTLNEHAIVSVADAAGRITDINDTFCRISGYSREELLGQDHRVLNSGQHPKSFWVEMWQTIASGRAWHGDVCNRAKDGSLYWVDSIIAPFRGTDGRIEKYVSIRSDITTRKRTEEELRALTADLERRVEERAAALKASEVRYRTLFDSIDEGFCIVEMIFDEQERPIDYRFLEISPSFEKQTGLRDAVGKRMRELAPGHEAHWFEIYGHIALTGEASRFQNRAEQLHRWYDVYAFRFGDPKDRQVAILFRDITEQRSMESAMRLAKEEADKANLAKSEFLARMSHEIRTPLNGVMGMIDLLRSSELDETQQHHTQLAHEAADALLTVINDILDFSKIEAGKVEIEAIEFDLPELIEDLTDLLAPAAAKKKLEVAALVQRDVPTRLVGDPTRIRQVLTNLIGNSLKFTEMGSVSVRVSALEQQAHSTLVRVEVVDTGIGIPADRVDRLFKSFSQVDSSTTRKFGGTGLGLAICKRLVELMGGEIGVHSEVGRGTTFWFTVKLGVVAMSEAHALVPMDRLSEIRLLAIAPDPVRYRILKEQLDGWLASARTFANREDALQAMRKAAENGKPFHVALVPGGLRDGGCFAAIQQDERLRGTKCIALLDVEDRTDPHMQKGTSLAGGIHWPMTRSKLFDAIVSATTAKPKRRQAPSAAESYKVALGGLHLLVAEDNSMNQVVTRAMLTRAGCTCEIVGNGALAVEAAKNQRYDAILMDCQMPEMDGMEAAGHIRQREVATPGSGHLPIIALTAEAIQGDRERCLAAGMDGYVTKPINAAELYKTIQMLVRPSSAGTGEASRQAANMPLQAAVPVTTPAPKGSPVIPVAAKPIDAEALFNRCMKDAQFANESLEEFGQCVLKGAEQLRQGIANAEVAEATRFAHNLKSVAAHVAAEPLRAIAFDIEQAGIRKELSTMAAQMQKLDEEIKRCVNYVPQAAQEIRQVAVSKS